MKMRVWGLIALAALALAAPTAQASVRSQVLYARGLVPFNRGYWEQAYRLFNDAVRADPKDAQALYYRGLTQARRGSTSAAITDIQNALELDPALEHAPLDLGVAYLDQGSYADARLWLEKAYRQGADKMDAALFLGVALYRLEDFPGALKYFEEAKGDPETRQAALYYGGLALIRLDQNQQGRNAITEAAREHPDTDIGRAANRYLSGGAPEALPVEQVMSQRFTLLTDARMEYDSNVVIGSKDGPSGTHDDPDGRGVIGVAGRGVILDTDWGQLSGAAGLSQSIHFSRTDFDLTSTRTRLEWAGHPGRWTYGASAGYDFYGLDYQSFYQDVVVSPWLAFYENDITATQGYYTFRYRDFFRGPFDPFRDGFNNAVGLRQYVLLPNGFGIFHGGYQFDYESPEDTGKSDPYVSEGAKDFEYMGQQIDLEVDSAIDLPGLGTIDGALGYRFRYYGYTNDNSRSREEDPSDPKKRSDFGNLFALTLARDLNQNIPALQNLTQRTDVTLSLIANVNSSNLDVFEYNRVIGALGLRAQF